MIELGLLALLAIAAALLGFAVASPSASETGSCSLGHRTRPGSCDVCGAVRGQRCLGGN